MVCQSCGCPVEGAFCSKCGAPLPPPAPPVYGAPQPIMVAPRVQGHVQMLGIFWCVFGIYRAASGIIAALFLMGISTPGFFGGSGGWDSTDQPAADRSRSTSHIDDFPAPRRRDDELS